MKKVMYGKMVALFLALTQVTALSGCAKEKAVNESTSGSSLFEPIGEAETDKAQDAALQDAPASETQTENVQEEIPVDESEPKKEDSSVIARKDGERFEETIITDEQALLAIQKYCYINNPDLENIVNEGEYQVYWDVSSSDAGEIVVLFRSYTGALIRYYIDPATGDTYVTEFVPGIMDDEERTDETFNIKDYMD